MFQKISKNITENYDSSDEHKNLVLNCTDAFHEIEKLEVAFDDVAVIEIVTDLFEFCNKNNIEQLPESVSFF